MKKRLTALVLCLVLCLTTAACGAGSSDTAKNSTGISDALI